MNHPGFFIVGASRSGTTLLQSILSRHEEIYSAPETSFFNRIVPRLGVGCNHPDATLTAAQLSVIEQDFHYTTGLEVQWQGRLQSGTTVRESFEALLASYNEQDKPRWVEKTTGHVRAMWLIRRFYPEARFVHLVRDPVDVVGSHKRIKPGELSDLRMLYYEPITGYARSWQHCVRAAMLYPEQANVLHLYYEDLVRAPEETVRRVCEFYGLDFSDSLLTGFEQEAGRLFSPQRNPWQLSNTQPGFNTGAIGKARRELSAGDIWLIQRVVREEAMALGYIDESQAPGAPAKLLSLLREVLRYAVYATSLELIVRSLLAKLSRSD